MTLSEIEWIKALSKVEGQPKMEGEITRLANFTIVTSVGAHGAIFG